MISLRNTIQGRINKMGILQMGISAGGESIPDEKIKLVELNEVMELWEFEDYRKIQEGFGDYWLSMSREEKKFIVSIITTDPNKRITPKVKPKKTTKKPLKKKKISKKKEVKK